MDPRNIEQAVERMEALAPAAPVIPEEWVDDEDPSVGLGHIDSPGSADWAMKRLGECETQIESIETQKAAAIARIEKRAASLVEKARRGVGYFQARLAEYAETHRSTLCPGKKKSADLLHGRLGWRSRGGKLKVTDKAALLVWLERQPPESGLYRLKVEPEMKAIQDHFKRTNEIPQGCEFELPEDVFYVEPLTGNLLPEKE